MTPLEQTMADFDRVIARVDYVLALVKLTKQHSPYRPLVRAMCSLKLIKSWSV
jgi:hypothetical protein